MSKFLKIMIVLLTIAAVAAPVMAEERLGLSGQMRVRGWYLDSDDNTYRDSKGVDHTYDSSTYFDQRLRIGAKIAVADGVTLNFRTDLSEQDWGTDSGYGRQAVHVDRAYLDINGYAGRLIAGQYNLVVGSTTIDSQDTGFIYTAPTSVPVSVFYQLVDDNEKAARDGSEADSHLYGVKVTLKNDTLASDIFVAGQKGGTDAGATDDDMDIYLIGATLATTAGPVKLNAELDFFDGDVDGLDAMGIQGFIDGSIAATEAVTVGATFFYAMAADDDGDEQQIIELGNNFNDTDALNHGPLANDDLLNRYQVYDFTGDSAGVVALKVYADIKVSDATAVSTSIAYATTEDDDRADDDVLTMNVGVTQQLMENVSMAAQIGFSDQDSQPDSTLSAGAALYVNF